MKTKLPVIFSGDLNAINTSPSFAIFASAGFGDSWTQVNRGNPGFTCCQVFQNGGIVDVINNPTSFLNQRFDYVLLRGDVQASRAILVGANPFGRTNSRRKNRPLA
jgi:hypothetical protein